MAETGASAVAEPSVIKKVVHIILSVSKIKTIACFAAVALTDAVL